ncbi:hypothetical protein [Staphylococcus epidermidis]|uniref:hypothetical protein n=1 Tax=Staphylococcus epidermidis TaxID=1282 RepID=UPI0021A7ECE8|nr:hypothetical protein [Staphylococcus epidermidis]MCT1513157.1 hypothetical protein [Staphylococcus epidermidis]
MVLEISFVALWGIFVAFTPKFVALWGIFVAFTPKFVAFRGLLFTQMTLHFWKSDVVN